MNRPAAFSGEISSADETRFAIPEAHCAGCMAKIENGLLAIGGIHAARINLTSKQVSIAHDSELNGRDLAEAIRGIGFEAVPIAQDDAPLRSPAEYGELLRALAVAGFAAMNVMLLSVSIWSGADGPTRALFHWISALIALPAIAYAGRPFFRSAWHALRRGRTNMDVPIAIGVTVTAAMSLYETLIGGPHAWFESALMLLFFLLAGRTLDAMMRGRVSDGVAALARQRAPGALVLSSADASRWVDADALEPGMHMLVAAGERLAADGRVVEGVSLTDNGLLTGEAEPVAVAGGSDVYAGTLNIAAPMTVEVTAASDRSVIAEIVRLMETAGQSRSRYVRVAERAARLYAPVVHMLALASFAGWMIAGAGWHEALLIGVAVLIITCPCALGLAVPVAQVVVTGALMRRGILVSHESALERLAEADRAVFDKTGTLTLGRPTPEDLESLSDDNRTVALALARASRHPLAQALRDPLEAMDVAAAQVERVSEQAGSGVSAMLNGRRVALERPRHAQDAPAVALTVDGAETAVIRFADALRPAACDAVRDLGRLGLPGSILSGDSAAAVRPIAAAVGLTAQTGVRPQDKSAALARLSAAGNRVLMIGDGLNDGPALAAAHVSIAPGSASDVGQNAADLILLGDSLEGLPLAVRAARATTRVVRQNFALAIGYNAVAIPIAVAGYVTPLVAAVAMSLSSLIVLGNSMRLRSIR